MPPSLFFYPESSFSLIPPEKPDIRIPRYMLPLQLMSLFVLHWYTLSGVNAKCSLAACSESCFATGAGSRISITSCVIVTGTAPCFSKPVFTDCHHFFHAGTLIPAAKWHICHQFPRFCRWNLEQYRLDDSFCMPIIVISLKS